MIKSSLGFLELTLLMLLTRSRVERTQVKYLRLSVHLLARNSSCLTVTAENMRGDDLPTYQIKLEV